MSKETLTTFYTTAALASLYLAINAISRCQQLGLELPGIKFEWVDPQGATLFGILIAGPALALTLFLARYHLRRFGSGASRLPIAGGVPISKNRQELRVYQVITSGVLLWIPFLIQLHFVEHFLRGTLFLNSAPVATGLSLLTPRGGLQDQFRYAEANGKEFFPWWEPGVLVLIVATLAWLAISLIRELARPARESGK